MQMLKKCTSTARLVRSSVYSSTERQILLACVRDRSLPQTRRIVGSGRMTARRMTAARPAHYPSGHGGCTSDLNGSICSYFSLRGWCARRSDKNPYLQIDLLMPHTITKLATQGAASNWVKRFSLAFSYDNINWFNYTVNGVLKVGLEVTLDLTLCFVS